MRKLRWKSYFTRLFYNNSNHNSSRTSGRESSLRYRGASRYVDACSERLGQKNDFDEVALKKAVQVSSITIVITIVVANIVGVIVV